MKTLLIIDAHSLIHRAFHALPPLLGEDNKPTGALYGLSSMLLKVIKDLKPNFAVAAYDRPEPTFRKDEYQDYKIHRKTLDNDLISQLNASRDVFKAFHINSFDSLGFEADDVIATLVYNFKKNNNLDKIIILTGDLDALQLVEDDKVVVWTPKQGISEFKEYNVGAVVEKLGVIPSLVPDFKGLVGDSSDNIPGVSGIGPKTASSILNTYGTLEDFFELSPAPKTTALKNILTHKADALLSKRLATVRYDVPLRDILLEELSLENLKNRDLITFFESMGFRNLVARVQNMGL